MLVLFALAYIVGCEDPELELKKTEDQYWANLNKSLAEAGFIGEHELVKRPDSMILLRGTLDYSSDQALFFSSSNAKLDFATGPNLQFWWKQRSNEILLSVLPVDKLRIVIDDSKEIPTIEFIISGDHWKYGPPGNCNGNNTRCLANERHVLPEKDRNFNQDIMSSDLKEAKVRISAKDLKRELFLLKFRN